MKAKIRARWYNVVFVTNPKRYSAHISQLSIHVCYNVLLPTFELLNLLSKVKLLALIISSTYN